jgi:hypothetical protein
MKGSGNMSEQNFRLRWYTKPGAKPLPVANQFQEAVEAIEYGEELIGNHQGSKPGAKVEVYFNSDTEPHSILYLTHDLVFGIWNRVNAPFPVSYAEGTGNGVDIPSAMEFEAGFPEYVETRDKDKAREKKEGSKGEEKRDDDSDEMKIKEPPPADHYDDDSDEDDTEDDDSGAEEPQDEPQDVGGDSDPSDEDEGTEDESGDEGEPSDEGGNGEDEKEKPRVNLFAKFRGPKGWRKRAENDPERGENQFVLRVGKLLENGTEDKQPLVVVNFKEVDEQREFGTLTIRLPEGVELKAAKKGRTYLAIIPYDEP